MEGFANPCMAALINSVSKKYVSYVGNPKLMNGVMSKIKIPFPKIKEQQKIAACLSSLDDVIKAETQKLELLKEHKKGLLQNLFPQEGETVPKLRFPDFKDNGEWELMQISNILNAESSNLALNKLELKQSGYAVYGADSIVGYIENFQHKEPYISIVKDGSGVGRLNLCDGETSTLGTLSSLKSKDEKKYKVVWAFYLLNTIDFSSYVKGSGIPHIYFSDYKSENIGVPKTEEQQKIASCLSSLDDLINSQSQKIETLKLHKKGLLQGLFPPVKEDCNG
jgi:type I restriction enzyme S subunit